MTDREINEAVSEACGIPICRHPLRFGGPPCCNGVTRPLDYCNDLNAIHAAESSLSVSASVLMEGNLDERGCWPIWHATARQRAEAFLRTVGKWKEEAHT